MLSTLIGWLDDFVGLLNIFGFFNIVVLNFQVILNENKEISNVLKVSI